MRSRHEGGRFLHYDCYAVPCRQWRFVCLHGKVKLAEVGGENCGISGLEDALESIEVCGKAARIVGPVGLSGHPKNLNMLDVMCRSVSRPQDVFFGM